MLNSAEITHLREASRLQEGLAWILSELGEMPISFPTHLTSSDPVRIAGEERARLGVTTQQQLQWSSASQALNAWRKVLEGKGVMVLLLSIGSSSSRGFSLWNDYAPLIAANTHWNNQARTFTLFHEYAHLITRTSSSCTGHIAHRIRQGEDPIERWCERFAAAFLAPWEDVQRSLIETCGWSRGEVVRDLRVLRKLANLFRISLRAMTLRLIDHDIAGWDLYSQIPSQADGKPAGGGGGGRNRLQIRLDEYGSKPAQIFVRGLHNDVLSRTDVLDYLDIGDSDLDFVESGRAQG
jgi:Zn-dependent peptidase ImmA (M78 family)